MAPKKVSVEAQRRSSGSKRTAADADLQELPDYAIVVLDSLAKSFTHDRVSGLHDLLDEMFPIRAAREVFADKVEAAFPPTDSVQYSADLHSNGPALLRPWMLGWKKELGQKGFNTEDDIKNLMTLILLQGMKTDAARLMGVECLAVEAAELEGYEIVDRGGGHWWRSVHQRVVSIHCAPLHPSGAGQR